MSKKNIHVKEKHFVVDMMFGIGGAIIGTGISELMAGSIGILKPTAAIIIGALVFFSGAWVDRRNVQIEEHEIAEAEHKAEHPWETES